MARHTVCRRPGGCAQVWLLHDASKNSKTLFPIVVPHSRISQPILLMNLLAAGCSDPGRSRMGHNIFEWRSQSFAKKMELSLQKHVSGSVTVGASKSFSIRGARNESRGMRRIRRKHRFWKLARRRHSAADIHKLLKLYISLDSMRTLQIWIFRPVGSAECFHTFCS